MLSRVKLMSKNGGRSLGADLLGAKCGLKCGLFYIITIFAALVLYLNLLYFGYDMVNILYAPISVLRFLENKLSNGYFKKA